MAHTRPTRIAVCADTHFWPGASRRFGLEQNQLQPWSDQIQAALIDELRSVAPDLVLHLGDLTCGGGAFDMPLDLFYRSLDSIYEVFQSLPGDCLLLPGNHDCPAGGDWSYAEKRLGLGPGLGLTVDLAAARLVLLNAQGHSRGQLEAAWPGDPVYGWVNEAELARLDQALATAGGRPVLIFVHQLLRPWVGAQLWVEHFRVKNAAAVLEILARHQNVAAVFQAHAHCLDVHQEQLGARQCWFVVAPAIIDYPLGWLQLDLSPGQLQVTMQRLSLPELAELGRQSGHGQDWRAGRPAWQKFSIGLS